MVQRKISHAFLSDNDYRFSDKLLQGYTLKREYLLVLFQFQLPQEFLSSQLALMFHQDLQHPQGLNEIIEKNPW